MLPTAVADTNIVIHLLHGTLKPSDIGATAVFLSTISICELFALPGMSENEEALIENTIRLYFHAVPVNENIAKRAGRLARTKPSRRRRSDLIIAATAVELGIPLITFNQKDFVDIRQLKLEGL